MEDIPNEGSVIEVTVFKLGREGDGIAKLANGFLVIVKGGKPYQRVKAKIIKSAHTYCIAEVVEEIPADTAAKGFEGGRKAAHWATD